MYEYLKKFVQSLSVSAIPAKPRGSSGKERLDERRIRNWDCFPSFHDNPHLNSDTVSVCSCAEAVLTRILR